jgi:hypothetical protein
VVSGFCFAVAFFLTKPVGYVVSTPISRFLNYITTVQIRRSTLGNDVKGGVGWVAPMPGGFPSVIPEAYGLVHGEIEVALSAFADKHAAKTLANARAILGLISLGDRDVIKSFTEQLSWNELIHTAYFEVDEFAKLIAYVLHKAGLAPLTEKFKSDPDFEKIRSAYEAMPSLAAPA